MQSFLNIIKDDRPSIFPRRPPTSSDIRRAIERQKAQQEAQDLNNVFTQRQNKDAERLADEINNIVSLVSRNKKISSNAFIFTRKLVVNNGNVSLNKFYKALKKKGHPTVLQDMLNQRKDGKLYLDIYLKAIKEEFNLVVIGKKTMGKIKSYLRNPNRMFNTISDKIINQHEAEEAGDTQESGYNFRDVKKVNSDYEDILTSVEYKISNMVKIKKGLTKVGENQKILEDALTVEEYNNDKKRNINQTLGKTKIVFGKYKKDLKTNKVDLTKQIKAIRILHKIGYKGNERLAVKDRLGHTSFGAKFTEQEEKYITREMKETSLEEATEYANLEAEEIISDIIIENVRDIKTKVDQLLEKDPADKYTRHFGTKRRKETE
jgi:hypothetical protein